MRSGELVVRNTLYHSATGIVPGIHYETLQCSQNNFSHQGNINAVIRFGDIIQLCAVVRDFFICSYIEKEQFNLAFYYFIQVYGFTLVYRLGSQPHTCEH